MSFKKIDETGRIPGPRAIFFSGYPEETEEVLKNFFTKNNIEGINVIPCRSDAVNLTVEEVLQGKAEQELVPYEKLPPVMVWSGISHNELDQLLGAFSETGLKRPIFATATEANLSFSLKELLNHLLAEQRSMREAMQNKN